MQALKADTGDCDAQASLHIFVLQALCCTVAATLCAVHIHQHGQSAFEMWALFAYVAFSE